MLECGGCLELLRLNDNLAKQPTSCLPAYQSFPSCRCCCCPAVRPLLQGAAQAALFAYLMQAAGSSYRNMTVYTLGMPQVGEGTCLPAACEA